MKRSQYTPPFYLTRYGWGWSPKVRKGCDEYHNKSWYVITPLGCFTWFGAKVWYPQVEGMEHLYAHGPEGWEGRLVEGCEICQEILDIDEESV